VVTIGFKKDTASTIKHMKNVTDIQLSYKQLVYIEQVNNLYKPLLGSIAATLLGK